MNDTLARVIEGLLSQLGLGKIALIILILALGAFFLFIAYQAFTSDVELTRLERAIGLFGSLQEIKDKGIDDEQSKVLYERLSAQLLAITSKENPISLGRPFWKFLAAVFPWLLLGLAFFPGLRAGDPNTFYGLFGVLALGIPFGIIGVFLPERWWPWVNLIIYPIGHFLAVVLSITTWQTRKARTVRVRDGA